MPITDTTTLETPVAPESLASKMLASLPPEPVIEKPVIAAKPESKTDTANETQIADAEHTDDTDDEEEVEAPDDDGEDDDAEDSETDEQADEIDAQVASAWKKFGVPLDLADVPKEARAPLITKLKAMEKGYTKAMQEARSYRQEKAEFETLKDYSDKHPDQHIVDLLAKDPTLIERVNAEMKKREDPTYSEALQMKRDAAKDRAAADAKAQADQQADHDAHCEALDAYVLSAVKNAKVPYDLVEEAIQLATERKYKAGQGLITEAEIQAIIDAKAKVYQRGLSGAKGAEKRKYVEQKVDDKKKTTNKTKPTGTGVTPTPAVDLSKLTLREKMLATLDAQAA